MKDLYLKLTDRQRPLNARGRHDAPLMGKALSEEVKSIDELIISPSERTKETSLSIKECIKFSSERIVDRLYHASVVDILDVISLVDDAFNSALLIGHNPGLTNFYNKYASEVIDNLPTCGVYRIRISSSQWLDLDTTNAQIDFFKYPKMYY